MAGTAAHTEYGDRDLALSGEILRTVVGSGVHGIAIEGTDDHDEMGVFVEPPQHVVGIGMPFDHYVFRTRSRSGERGRQMGRAAERQLDCSDGAGIIS